MGRREPRYETKAATIVAPVAERSARGITTCGVYAVVSHASILHNCFFIGLR